MKSAAPTAQKARTPLGLPAEWFWDVNPARLNPDKHAAQIIERVLVVGAMEGWRAIRRHYGDEKLSAVVTGLRSLSPQNVALLCLALNLKKEDFRCCTAKPFPQAPWHY
ncbi:MAG: hypothetical protein K9N47_15990 [Prosthecobacter sp.]|jgi:hypothetical protein|uniref:DUF6922 domain-containing protein n=1 Tax=Prosthecobacter sp. TaxID=1965333 RepID=UPI0025CF1273|nr:hypothetical protein [Prosthecobacter sp.]MCF7787631.1 hypothetical protein [Prosthecobacter sp.]